MSGWRTSRASLAFAAACALARAASATVYNDTTGDNYGPAYVDLANVAVTNDASNITFQLNLNPSANILASDGSQIYGKYQIGLQTAAGGSTAVSNPYGNTIGISSGMNWWIGGWTNNSATPPFSGYCQVEHWNGSGWDTVAGFSSNPFVDTPTTLTATSVSFTVPLASLGLSNGSSFKFDVWTTFDNPGGQSAYDALDKPTQTFDPNGADRPWLNSPYDSATSAGSTFNSTTYTVNIGATNATWNVDADGNWSQASNWTPNTAANGSGAVANFGSAITAPHTVTVDSPQTVGQINFSNTNKYTIAGASLLTLDASSAGVGITVNSGSHDITAPLLLAKDTTLTITPAASVLTLSNLQSSAVNLTKAGAGRAILGGSQGYSGSTTVTGGTLQLKGSATWNAALNGPGTTDIAGSAASAVVFDYNDGSADPAATIKTILTNAYAGNFASGQIHSSTAQASVIGLGWKDDTSAKQVTVLRTYYGDANLDASVDTVDFNLLAASFSQSGKSWGDGDFNYDGSVDTVDFNLLASNFSKTLASAPGQGSLVPEPAAAVTIATMMGAAFMQRRRREDAPGRAR